MEKSFLYRCEMCSLEVISIGLCAFDDALEMADWEENFKNIFKE